MTVARGLKVLKAWVALSVGVQMSALPVVAWSHPGHGLDGLWAHNMLHTATAVLAVALIVMLAARFTRIRKHKKRS